jgi:hypothetical protein
VGADEEGGGAVVGRAPRTEEEKTGAPSVRALTCRAWSIYSGSRKQNKETGGWEAKVGGY